MTNPGGQSLVRATVNLLRYPVKRIPYLVLAQWALSDPDKWSRAAELRTSLALEPVDARGLFFDDLRRSLSWRPKTGITMEWDDILLRLRLSFNPNELGVNSRRVLAKLRTTVLTLPQHAALLDARDAGLIDGHREDLAALEQVLPVAPPVDPRPAFRVDFGELNLPGAFPGGDRRDRARRAYEDAKASVQSPDYRLHWDNEKLTLSIDEWDAIPANRFLTMRLLDLVRFAPGEPPQDHPDSADNEHRRTSLARSGAIFRRLEHAFGVPAYGIARRLERLAMDAAFTPADIDEVYRAYDYSPVARELASISAAVAMAGDIARPDIALNAMLPYGGFVAGERHDIPDLLDFFSLNMATVKAAGYTHFVMEGFDWRAHQALLDDFNLTGQLGGRVRSRVESIDDRWHGGRPVHTDFLRRAYNHNMKIVATEHLAAQLAVGTGRLLGDRRANAYDYEKRLCRFNFACARIVREYLPKEARIIVFTGRDHVQPTEFGYPGLAQLLRLPAVEIRRRDDGRLAMDMLPEPPNRRPDPGIGAIPVAREALETVRLCHQIDRSHEALGDVASQDRLWQWPARRESPTVARPELRT